MSKLIKLIRLFSLCSQVKVVNSSGISFFLHRHASVWQDFHKRTRQKYKMAKTFVCIWILSRFDPIFSKTVLFLTKISISRLGPKPTYGLGWDSNVHCYFSERKDFRCKTKVGIIVSASILDPLVLLYICHIRHLCQFWFQ